MTLTDDSVVTIDEANITPETIAEYKSRIKAVELGENIESVANDTFRNISTLESVKLNYAAETGDYAFGENNALTEVILGKNVKSIGNKQFNNCSNLININIPNSVTRIGEFAFDGTAWYNNQPEGVVYAGLVAYKYNGIMPSETSITLKDGTKGISGYAFSYCYGLTSVTIPNSVTSIGKNVFSNCNNLESISVESGNTKYDSRDNCNAIIETATNTLIYGCKNTIIPNSVTSIDDYAFVGCSGLTSVVIPNSVTTIGQSAFSNCSSLTSATIGNSVTTIGGEAFAYCNGLTSITIPDSVITIGTRCFYECNSMHSVMIGNSIETIDTNAFLIGSLTNITINAITPPELNEYPFDTSSSYAILVPAESVSAYKAASSWSSYVNRIQAIQ